MQKAISKGAAKEAAEFLALPYDKRQKLIVVDDDTLAQATAGAGAIDIRGDDLAQLAAFGFIFGPVGAVALPIAGAVLGGLYNYFNSQAETWRPYIIKRSQSRNYNLRFPAGHPHDKVLYIGHPLDSRLYYPVADFHHHMMLHKVDEARRILVALRATTIEIQHQSGYARELSAKMAFPSDVLPAVESGVRRKSAGTVLWKGTYDYANAAGKRRTLPRNLMWYPQEAAWQMFVNDAKRGTLKEFSLGVKYDQDFGVNSKLKAEVLNLKLELGGDFVDHQATEWNINAKFGD